MRPLDQVLWVLPMCTGAFLAIGQIATAADEGWTPVRIALLCFAVVLFVASATLGVVRNVRSQVGRRPPDSDGASPRD